MKFDPNNPTTWSYMPTIITHDVGRSRDRSTAVVGGLCTPYAGPLIGMEMFLELPQARFGTECAEALAIVDRHYGSTAIILADISSDASYAEILAQRFGRRVIGLHISRSGDGLSAEMRGFSGGYIPVYTVGRNYLLDHYHNLLVARQIRFADGPEARLAYQQLANLEVELRETGKVYRCPPSRHDDLGISCAMLAFMARHPHLPHYIANLRLLLNPPKPRPPISSRAWT